MREADRFEKTVEGPDVPHQACALDFLLRAEPRVGAQRVRWVGRVPDQRQQATRQRRIEVEATPEFRCHEGMHDARHGAASQQVDARALEFAGAGGGEREARALRLLHQLMHDREQFGNALDFVDHDVASRGLGCGEFAQALRAGRVEAVLGRRQQINPGRSRQGPAQPGALARTPGPEQEEMPGRRVEEFALDFHFSTHYGKFESIIRPTHALPRRAAPGLRARRQSRCARARRPSDSTSKRLGGALGSQIPLDPYRVAGTKARSLRGSAALQAGPSTVPKDWKIRNLRGGGGGENQGAKRELR